MALMSRELMEDLGCGAEKVMNITVREALRRGGRACDYEGPQPDDYLTCEDTH
jgi:hypothetical protein